MTVRADPGIANDHSALHSAPDFRTTEAFDFRASTPVALVVSATARTPATWRSSARPQRSAQRDAGLDNLRPVNRSHARRNVAALALARTVVLGPPSSLLASRGPRRRGDTCMLSKALSSLRNWRARQGGVDQRLVVRFGLDRAALDKSGDTRSREKYVTIRQRIAVKA